MKKVKEREREGRGGAGGSSLSGDHWDEGGSKVGGRLSLAVHCWMEEATGADPSTWRHAFYNIIIHRRPFFSAALKYSFLFSFFLLFASINIQFRRRSFPQINSTSINDSIGSEDEDELMEHFTEALWRRRFQLEPVTGGRNPTSRSNN